MRQRLHHALRRGRELGRRVQVHNGALVADEDVRPAGRWGLVEREAEPSWREARRELGRLALGQLGGRRQRIDHAGERPRLGQRLALPQLRVDRALPDKQ